MGTAVCHKFLKLRGYADALSKGNEFTERHQINETENRELNAYYYDGKLVRQRVINQLFA